MVEHCLREAGVVGSNPVTPTNLAEKKKSKETQSYLKGFKAECEEIGFHENVPQQCSGTQTPELQGDTNRLLVRLRWPDHKLIIRTHITVETDSLEPSTPYKVINMSLVISEGDTFSKNT